MAEVKKGKGEKKGGSSPAPPSAREKSAKAKLDKPNRKPKPKRPPGVGRSFRASDIPHDPSMPVIKKIMGRPKDTPDLWTPEYIAEVAGLIRQYTDASDYPTEAEFCYSYDIAHQRILEFPALKAAMAQLFAKRQAITIRRGTSLGIGEGALGSFLSKLAANAGSFSMTEKQELAHSGELGVRIVDDIK